MHRPLMKIALQASNIALKENLGLPKSRVGPHFLSISKTAATLQIIFTILQVGLDRKNAKKYESESKVLQS